MAQKPLTREEAEVYLSDRGWEMTGRTLTDTLFKGGLENCWFFDRVGNYAGDHVYRVSKAPENQIFVLGADNKPVFAVVHCSYIHEEGDRRYTTLDTRKVCHRLEDPEIREKELAVKAG